jgi:CSLREA domain-containing protein
MPVSRITVGGLVAVAYLGLTMVTQTSAYAVSFTVTSSNDISDSNPGDGICASLDFGCTLRAAIEESNAANNFPTDQIILPNDIYGLTLGELPIRNSLFITGSNPAATIIDGGGNSRIFSIGNEGLSPIVNISNLTIRNGNGGSFVNGGGIFINEGSSLGLFDSIVRDNKSLQFGGGISNAGFLQIVRSTIQDNQVPTDGGGGQTASGGGIFNFLSGSIEIDRSTISGNRATRGGGIRNGGGRLNITNSTISGNRATNRGGGIMTSGVTNIAYSTITNNEANAPLGGSPSDEDRFGGGIYSDRGTVNIGNSILAGNLDNRSRFDLGFAPDCYSVPPETTSLPGQFITSFRGNIVGVSNTNCVVRDTIFGTDFSFDQVGTSTTPLDPKLAPLANNGGSTQTHALLLGSPAIDRGDGITSATFFDCPSTDQRGAVRPFDGNGDGNAVCDVGAFEFGASIPTPPPSKSVPEPTSILGLFVFSALGGGSIRKWNQKRSERT